MLARCILDEAAEKRVRKAVNGERDMYIHYICPATIG
jgi:hypothetical protein